MKKLGNTESKLNKFRYNMIPAWFIFILVVLCELIVRIFKIKHYILPAPSAVIIKLVEDRSILFKHTMTTLLEAGIGFCIAIVLAILLAGLMNHFKLFKLIFYPILVISQTIPIIALAPLFLVWFGLGILPKVIVVIVVCFFPIVVSLVEGLAVVDQDMINLMKVLKAKPIQIFLKVQVPATLPAFFSGLKIAATYSIMGAVIAEWLGAKDGLGIYMTRSMSSFQTDALFADIIVIVAISMGVFKIIDTLGKKLMPWNK